jgi:DNA-directed RNA polymerase subunit RPC12/RpoP
VLGVVISLLAGLPLIGGGIFVWRRGEQQADRRVAAQRQRQILDMVKTRGQVELTDLVIELDSTTDQVREDIYKLVGMGLFTGYVNWNEGVLYSQEASQLTGNSCPNCGGEQTIAGKGVITCRYCGAEIFL